MVVLTHPTFCLSTPPSPSPFFIRPRAVIAMVFPKQRYFMLTGARLYRTALFPDWRS